MFVLESLQGDMDWDLPVFGASDTKEGSAASLFFLVLVFSHSWLFCVVDLRQDVLKCWDFLGRQISVGKVFEVLWIEFIELLGQGFIGGLGQLCQPLTDSIWDCSETRIGVVAVLVEVFELLVLLQVDTKFQVVSFVPVQFRVKVREGISGYHCYLG